MNFQMVSVVAIKIRVPSNGVEAFVKNTKELFR